MENSVVEVKILFHNCKPKEAVLILKQSLEHKYGKDCVQIKSATNYHGKSLPQRSILSR